MTTAINEMKATITIKPNNPDFYVRHRSENEGIHQQDEFEFIVTGEKVGFSERIVNLIRSFSIELRGEAYSRLEGFHSIRELDRITRDLFVQANAPLHSLCDALIATSGCVDVSINNVDGVFSVKFEECVVTENKAEILIHGYNTVEFQERGISVTYSGAFSKLLEKEEGLDIRQTVVQWLDSVLTIRCTPFYNGSRMAQEASVERTKSEILDLAQEIQKNPNQNSYRIISGAGEIKVSIIQPSKKDDLGRVTKEHIESQIERVDYFTAADAIKDIPNGDHVLYCLITMKNGHQETAFSIAGNRNTFDPTRGRAAAYQKAIGQLFPKFYFLQAELNK